MDSRDARPICSVKAQSLNTRRMLAAIFERGGIASDGHDPIMSALVAPEQETEEVDACFLRQMSPVRAVAAGAITGHVTERSLLRKAMAMRNFQHSGAR